jgi:hypothetical protein
MGLAISSKWHPIKKSKRFYRFYTLHAIMEQDARLDAFRKTAWEELRLHNYLQAL